MSLFHVVLLCVAAARALELIYAASNTRRLLAQGGREAGRGHYLLLVTLHLAWLSIMFLAIPAGAVVSWPWLSLFLALQLGRVWVLTSLGRYWTTRIITLPGVPLVRRGPYRFFRHPNYLIVELEIISLPLAFGAAWIAVIFGMANAGLLFWRIRIEDEALASRRSAAQ